MGTDSEYGAGRGMLKQQTGAMGFGATDSLHDPGQVICPLWMSLSHTTALPPGLAQKGMFSCKQITEAKIF